MEAPLLAAEQVGFAFRRPVLEGLDVALPGGRILLLIGPNGAGKSTALSLFAGERQPKDGWVRVMGRNPLRASARRHLFLLHEEAAPPSHLTAAEAVRFHLDLYGRPPSTRPRVPEALERLGLADVAKRRVSTFSKGMQRRLELACLWAVDPELWLLDEPHSGLDPLGLRVLRELCADARSRGRGVVISSHALGDVPELADEILALRAGRVFFRGSREDLLAKAGARSFVFRGGGPGLDGAVRAAGEAHGAACEGPAVPAAAIEDLLFGGDGA